ncbi:kinase-like domain-containing protein [Mycena rosella]|uniref:Kinase-like domain-containing protein n=1 Tax=Mycena rosella TaxID=1033263 RepID=A0AAD7G4H9_MYCRO|nr:kinase-like domain-containing protein [Mycena rosella]
MPSALPYSVSMPIFPSQDRTLDPKSQGEDEEGSDFRDDFSDFHLIAANAYGTVNRALERATGRVVAVKTVICDSDGGHPNRYTSGDGRIAKDFTLLERTRHPHVLRILSVYCGMPGGLTHIILEYMEGGTLLEYLLEQNRQQESCATPGSFIRGLPEIACRDIMYQLCQAMSYVHRRGVLHCNLKPENILLTGDKMPFIKVAGFGLAIKSEGERMDIRGSFDYAAPEVVCHSGYDHRADSWSAGITLFAMLLLESPHVSGHHIAGEPIALEWDALRERLSEDGQDFLRRLLCEDPSGRCSMEEALHHRWLVYHRPMYPNILYP